MLCFSDSNITLVYCDHLQEADDNDYQTEESGSDATDSDIDLDENEEVTSDVEVEGEEKRKRRVITKAYKVSVNLQQYSVLVCVYNDSVYTVTHMCTCCQSLPKLHWLVS